MRRLAINTIASLLCVLTSTQVWAQNSKPSEYQVKAVFLYNFANFVDWPEDAFADSDSPLVIGIFGEDPFGKSLEEVVEDERIGKRKIEIKRWKSVADLGHCHILFTGSENRATIDSLDKRFKGLSVLTVGEMDGFAEAGGVIGFLMDENRIRFEINMASADRAKLTISSKLQKVAKRILRKGQ